MRTIPHRELRNNSSKVLADVKNGEVIEVTNHGEVVAILIPPTTSRLDALRRAGVVTAPRRRGSFSSLRRVEVTESSTDVVSELRDEQ